jgi:hypothetical protein
MQLGRRWDFMNHEAGRIIVSSVMGNKGGKGFVI